MADDPLLDQKKAEFYGQAVGAWLTTSFELDRSLLTLSTLGLGFHLVLIEKYGIASGWQYAFVLLAAISFVTCVVSVLLAFRANKAYLEKVAACEAPDSDPALSALDALSMMSFFVALLFSLLLGINMISNAYDKGQAMVNIKKIEQERLIESINRLANMAPDKIDKSANNMARLDPSRQQANPNPKPDTNKPADSGKQPDNYGK